MERPQMLFMKLIAQLLFHFFPLSSSISQVSVSCIMCGLCTKVLNQ